MTTQELFEKHPLTTKKIQDWYMDRMLESLKNTNIDEEFKKQMYEEGIALDKLSVFVDVQPRGLFDVLDENNIIILINYHSNIGFTWVVNDESDQLGYEKRKEAEKNAIEMAFQLLEEELLKEIVVN